VDFTFTPEQAALRDSVTRYLHRNYAFPARQALVASGRPSHEVWTAFAELGLLALPFPEAVGGLGGTVVDVVAVAEAFGEHLLVEPYLSSVLLAGRALAAAAPHPDASTWLDRLMAGEALGALAHEEAGGTADPTLVALRCTRSGAGYRLDGRKRLVLGGSDADVLVVTARVHGQPGDRDGLALLLVEPGAPGLQVTPFRTLDGRGAAHLDFDGVELPERACLTTDGYPVLASVLGDAVVALAAEAVGAMTGLLSRTSEHAATREQFGVPLARFQAVAHRLADMKLAHTLARATLLHTAALAEAGRATPGDLSVLKAQVGRLGRSVGEAAVQTHGGVGTTDELTIGHYLKRLLVLDGLLGDSEYHYRALGGARPAAGAARSPR
jgi:alkylation response protein AidB-like acyl-CoA dehydrogenase